MLPLSGICAPSETSNDFQTPPLQSVFKNGGKRKHCIAIALFLFGSMQRYDTLMLLQLVAHARLNMFASLHDAGAVVRIGNELSAAADLVTSVQVLCVHA